MHQAIKTPLRPELEPLPSRMQTLPVDERGYPVPWFVDWVNGKPEFRAMDARKWVEALKFEKCWVCGNRLGRYKTFVAGPMCGINRTSSEPPSHLECAQWSSRNCPFLANPKQVRRTDANCNPTSAVVGGFSIDRNPGVVLLWTTDHFTVFRDEMGGRLIRMGEPHGIEWICRGRKATREEVLHSIETGIPMLQSIAATQGEEGLRYLREQRERFEKWIPLE